MVETDRLAVVAYSVGRSDSFETLEAYNGDGHVVVDVAVKNRRETEFVAVPFYRGFTLRDGASTEYAPTVTGPEPELDAGALAPGQVARGFVTFDRVPVEATGLTLAVALTADASGGETATIDLESEGAGRTLRQDLSVPVSEVGDTTEYQNTRFTVNSFRRSTGGDAVTPRAANEFVFVDVTVANTGGDELFLDNSLQASLTDRVGRAYDFSTTALQAVDDGAVSVTVDPGGEERVSLGFQVETGTDPLYLVMDLERLGAGGRKFYRLR